MEQIMAKAAKVPASPWPLMIGVVYEAGSKPAIPNRLPCSTAPKAVNKQINKQTNKQINKQTDQQTNKQTNRQQRGPEACTWKTICAYRVNSGLVQVNKQTHSWWWRSSPW